MNNELIIEKFEKENKSSNNSSISAQLFTICSDSIFYFAIFMTAFLILKNIFPVIEIDSIFNLTINDVTVSSVGFINVLFYKFYKSFLTHKGV